MPSKQTHNDVIAIEELVNEIKQNLRLKAAPPSTTGATQALHYPLLQPTVNEQFLQQPKNINHPPQQQLVIKKQRSRPSPYHIPCRSWSETSTVQKQRSHLQKTSCKNDENNIEDPYELLQSLLKNNSLVKEAVRRLQLNNATASAYSRKQNYFYDSDEDNRSPIVMMCQLES
ncbi:CLUMA_CG016316, isoform A [Clunio marinus]|uniref:CLUMA_CG016316, isoform A n=1 Tax=Clunio marinus TaxID=568069 RepID=A0A1J1IT12_9DIPT|nr:CLUMA_CG016316, isoform A [Clunio marinus]